MTGGKIGAILIGAMMIVAGWGVAPLFAAQQGNFQSSQNPMATATQGAQRGAGAIGFYRQPLISEMLSMEQQLGPTPDQVQRLQTLRNTFDKQTIRLQGEMQSAQVDLNDLLASNAPDMQKVEAQEQKIASVQAQLRVARIKTLNEGRAVLSQEQWQKFQPLIASSGTNQWRGRRGQSYGPYGMGPGMMGGYYGGYGTGPGMMGGYGGYGMGPGMMGGYGPGGGGMMNWGYGS